MKATTKYKIPLKAVPAASTLAAIVIMSGLLGTQGDTSMAKSNKQLVE